MIDLISLLAQATNPAAGAGGGAPTAQPQPDFWRLMGPLLIAFAALYFFMFWSQRKERKKFADMLANLKRNDKVQTVGGVLGTVVEVRDDEVVLKVDENSNTKMRFARSAVKHVLHVAGSKNE